ncbi:MAG: putative enzyme related to lactoylglutathione lyase [Chlamydiales bacterium]|jgi:predicted enzyme related to lactoylglutathione lyase
MIATLASTLRRGIRKALKPMKHWQTSLIALTAFVPVACAHHGKATEPMESPAAIHTHHAIDYIEFTVSDMAASKLFFGAAFGWQFNDYGPDYAGIRKDGGEAGGLRLDSTSSNGGPLVVLYSADLEDTLARVRTAGGRITKEPFEFPGGRRFQFEDPSGNELAVWSEK